MGLPKPIPEEEKWPAPPIAYLRQPGKKMRLVYEPDRDNAKLMMETTNIFPSSIRSSFANKIDANAAVRRLEWEKIQASPDPEKALQQYNDFNSRWVRMPFRTYGWFLPEKEYCEYGMTATTEADKRYRNQYLFHFFNYRAYPKNSLQPTYFGYSLLVPSKYG